MAGAQRWEGLADELRLDMARLWTRNLGRDDRILSDTGREVPRPHAGRTASFHALISWD
jgi:asparagine synthetase B (glutamine-hydrolysing)